MSDFPTTRISLLVKVRDHADQQAWSDFVTLYQPVIYRFARRKGLQPADAQDLAQSVLSAVSQRIVDWKPDANRARFRTWLSRIAQNQAITMYRRRHADTACGGSGMLAKLRDHADDGDDSAEIHLQYRREVFRHAARRVRQEFEETTWQAFWMTSVEQVPVDDAAKSLGQSAGSIYTARSRVIRRLQEVVRLIQQEDDSLSLHKLTGDF